MGFHTLDPPPAPPTCSCLFGPVCGQPWPGSSSVPTTVTAVAGVLPMPPTSPTAPMVTLKMNRSTPPAPGCQKGKVQMPQLGGKRTPPPAIPILHLPTARPPDRILFQGHAMACFCHNEPPSLITTVITILLNIYCMFPNCSKCALRITPFNFPNNSVDGVGTIITRFYR